MQLKKRIVSLALAAMLLVTAPVSAFATTKFNQSVFNGREDIELVSDDMEGSTIALLAYQYDGSMTSIVDSTSFITVKPGLFLNDAYDSYILSFDYLGPNFAGMNSIIVKIGDNRYSFTNCYTSRSVTGEGLVSESISFFAKKETLDFMKDLADHQEEEIKVRINGSARTFDFAFSDSEKDGILNMYDLYISGGGTRETNMYKLSEDDPVYIAKNGKKVIGNVLPLVMYALSQNL